MKGMHKKDVMDKEYRLKIVQFDSVDSTNRYAYQLGEKGEREITVITARHQTMGKGRLGRRWSSPKDKGIYASFLLQPEKDWI